MTNKEKTDRITWNLFDDGFFYHNGIAQRKEIQKVVMQMALWKDEQYAWQKIPKDKDGFYDDLQKNLYNELPIIVMNKYDDGLYPSFEYICKDNWCDTVSDLSKPSYQYYMKVQEIPINQ